MEKQNLLTNPGQSVCLLIALALIGLSGCASNLEQRDATFRAFVTSVVQHMMDKNPDTIKASMTVLFRDELTEPVIEKLQKQNVLPHTELGILKVVDEEEDEHETGSVKIDYIKALGPVDKLVVPYQVTGATILKTTGKPDIIKPFMITLSCKLSNEDGDYPQVVDASVHTQPSKHTARGTKRRSHRQ